MKKWPEATSRLGINAKHFPSDTRGRPQRLGALNAM
ncbi:MAG: hypothetical protein ACI9XB_000332 [Gammaproteobacteria bacterium]|jgi:hypothetical protein